jgi:hypothetical protein
VILPGDLDGDLIGLRAAGDEDHATHVGRTLRQQLVRHLPARLVREIPVDNERALVPLLADSLEHVADPAADTRDTNAGTEIDVLAALRILNVDSLDPLNDGILFVQVAVEVTVADGGHEVIPSRAPATLSPFPGARRQGRFRR